MVTKVKSRGKAAGARNARIGTRLVAIRALNDLSQSKAAAAIGISAPSLRKLETGDWQGLADPHAMLVKAADVYGTSLDHIYGRRESAIERFASATDDIQVAQLSAITSGLARISQNHETLQFVDDLMVLLANELPDWPSLLHFRDSPAPERMALLRSVAEAAGRLVQDRSAIKYLSAIVLRYARKPDSETPESSESSERDEVSLSNRVSAIERMFGRTVPTSTAPLTPSRYRVSDSARGQRKKAAGKSRKPAKKK